MEIHRRPDHRAMVATAIMAEPIIYGRDGMHLDSILAFAAFMALPREDRDRMPPIHADEDPIDFDLPLAQWVCGSSGEDERHLCDSEGRLWGWCASSEIATWTQEGVAEVRKRPPIGEMARYSSSPSYSPGLGHMKAYDLKLPSVFAREIRWHAYGDPTAVLEMLDRHVPALGRKRNHGWGTVTRWRVEVCADDLSCFDADGLPMRRLPVAVLPTPPTGADLIYGRGAIRPPYHHWSREAMSVEPVR